MKRELSPKLLKLIEMYRGSLPGKQREIDGAWQAAAAADWNSDELKPLYHLVHKLAGSAGSYGFRELSEQTRKLDRRLSDTLAGEGPLDVAAAQADYDAILAAFERAQDADEVHPEP